ncbi:MAG: sodium:proton antiporter [Thermogutta sp.]
MSHEHVTSPQAQRRLVYALGVLFVVYAAALAAGWPQRATRLIVEAESHAHQTPASEERHTAARSQDPGESDPAAATAGGHGEATAEGDSPESRENSAGEEEKANPEAHAAHGAAKDHPPYWMVAPFVALLLVIAVFPLLPWTEHWWESNLHRFYVAAALAAVTLAYYLFVYPHPVEGHWPAHYVSQPSASGLHWGNTWAVFANAVLGEYVPFIVLLFSLYTISGGIRIEGDLRAKPAVNTAIIAVGGVLASFIGTTGAAMLMIRLLLDTNSERKHVVHTVVFFIFVVCNCGGCLLPIGDPPLFLGYLRGVPFLWTFQLWKEWLFVNGCLLAFYFLWDTFYFYPHETKRDVIADAQQVRRMRISGVWPNLPLLIGVVLAVALLDPTKAIPGTDFHPPLYLREIVQLGLVALSLILGDDASRRANQFNYAAIIEVAALFFGIFITMQPPLQILHVVGPQLGLHSPAQFFWATGALSSFLDNAPTYVVFFETARTLGGTELVPPGNGVDHGLLVAVSLGAVFMGANTYIGNGPNFMVRAIAEKRRIKMPSFFGYMVYSVCILIPLFLLTTFLFL